ncbi:unnamed protein product [Sphagnum jensenii]|uniref:Uncharacterized protein n=1 Tax=Sphagnum jensenii TaxID=128206 RepID=A0ABP1BB24_9BRYO
MASALLSACSMRLAASTGAPLPPRYLVSCSSTPTNCVAAPQVGRTESSHIRVSEERHVSRRDAVAAGGTTLLAGFLFLLPSDDAEARTKNPEVAKKLKEAIEKVKLKAKKTAEKATEAAKEAKATVAK